MLLVNEKINHRREQLSLTKKYDVFCAEQEKNRVTWFAIPALFFIAYIPCICLIGYLLNLNTDVYSFLLGITGFLFFSNVIACMVSAPMKYIISIFIGTTFLSTLLFVFSMFI